VFEWLGVGDHSLRVGTEMVPETSVIFTRENFINFCRREDWRPYKVTLHGEAFVSKVTLLYHNDIVGRFIRNVGKYFPN
jgi:hypothetical protein